MSRDDFDKFMVNKFPEIFRQRHLSCMETCMCWGFEIGEGWHDLIHSTCEKLELIRTTFNVTIEASQIKEKFGTLRFYFDAHANENEDKSNMDQEKWNLIYDVINDIIDSSERKSGYICEKCGKYGKTEVINGWYSTYCKAHYDETMTKKEEK